MNWLKAWVQRWLGEDVKLVELAVQVQNLKAELGREQDKHADTRGLLGETIKKLHPFRVVDAETPPPWIKGDAEEWNKFQRTGTGQRLLGIANFYEQATNRAAVSRLSGAENNAGYARGWSEATRYFFTKLLSADIQPQSDDDTIPSTGAAGTRERYAP